MITAPGPHKPPPSFPLRHPTAVTLPSTSTPSAELTSNREAGGGRWGDDPHTQTGETALTVRQLRVHGLRHDGNAAAASVWPAVEAELGELSVCCAQRAVARATALQAVATCDSHGCVRHVSAVMGWLAACIRCVRLRQLPSLLK